MRNTVASLHMFFLLLQNYGMSKKIWLETHFHITRLSKMQVLKKCFKNMFTYKMLKRVFVFYYLMFKVV